MTAVWYRLSRIAPGITIVGLVVTAMLTLGMVPLVSFSLDAAGTMLPCSQLPGTPEPLEGLRHITLNEPHEPYRTVPPTSGPHSPRVLSPGIYRQPIAEELQVHFLEHGHVLVQYSTETTAEAVAALEAVARRHPASVAVAPYGRLGHGIALTAWQRLQRIDRADAVAAEEFVARVVGRYDHGWQDGATDCLPAPVGTRVN